jgi:hypothetical protein
MFYFLFLRFFSFDFEMSVDKLNPSILDEVGNKEIIHESVMSNVIIVHNLIRVTVCSVESAMFIKFKAKISNLIKKFVVR